MSQGKLISLLVFGVIILIIAIVAIIKRQFIKESIQELKKVTWPSKDEALNSALVTILFILVFSLALAAFDYLINMIVVGLVR